jgi:outer membrane protein, heavy metal efflux system
MHLYVRRFVFPLTFVPMLYAQAHLTLADAVSQALASHPQLTAAAARVSAAEGLRRQAGLGPNPRLILQSENTRFPGSPPFAIPEDHDSYAYLAQTIETGGKRSGRVALATENIRRGEFDLQLERRQIASRVSAAYWSAAGAVEYRDLLQDAVTSFDRTVQLHRDRVREGAAPEVDLLRIEVERDRLITLARSAAQDAERDRITLFREMGKIDFPPITFAEDLERTQTVAALALDQVLEQRVEMKLARESVEQARANLRLQQSNAKPDPDVHLGYKRTAGTDTLYAAVQIPLPVRNRNQGQIEAAAAEVKVAESSVAATEALIRSEVESARRDYEARRKLLEDTLRPMRDHADEVYRIVDAAYQEAGTDLLRLLDAERTQIDTESIYVHALSEFQESVVALETAQGNLP